MFRMTGILFVAVFSCAFLSIAPGKSAAVRLAPMISSGMEAKSSKAPSARDRDEDRVAFARARMSTWKPGDALTLKSRYARGHERVDTTEIRQVVRAGYDAVAIRITRSVESIIPLQEVKGRREGGWVKTLTRSDEEQIFDFPARKMRRKITQWCDGRRMPPVESVTPLGDDQATELFPYLFILPAEIEMVTAAVWTFKCGVYDLDGGRRVWIDPMLPLGGLVMERTTGEDGDPGNYVETRLVSVSARDPRVRNHLEKCIGGNTAESSKIMVPMTAEANRAGK